LSDGSRPSVLPAVPGTDEAPSVSHKALLAWAEHCVECAAPACYSTCDLYLATAAGKCRRIEDGIVPNRSLAGPDGPAAEVRFRRWGKLEAQGNATLMPIADARRAEGLLVAATPLGARIGRSLAKVTGQSRWATAMEALHTRNNDRLQSSDGQQVTPDAFLAEVYNPGSTPVRMILTAAIDKARLTRQLRSDQLPRPMSVAFDPPPGHSRHTLAVDQMRDILASGLPFNLAITPADDDTPHLIFRRLDLVAFEKTAPSASDAAGVSKSPGKDAKLVIFDLDNTLWDGILLEGEVTLRPGIADLFRTLDERGVLISVASKNAHDDAMAQLKAFGLAD
jgi:hypothetical protein